MSLTMHPIGVVRNERMAPLDDDWDAVTSTIHLDLDAVGTDATDGLLDFSHVEVVYVFHLVDERDVVRGVRHPRGNAAWPAVGILAQRPKARPNRLGVTVCELIGLRPGEVVVRGLDAIDGTPVLDIKPYMAEFGPRGDVRQPPWSRELMAGYWQRPSAPPGRLDEATAAAWLDEVQRSPSDHGTVELIVRRPAVGEREVLEIGELDTAVGLVGDNWLGRGSRNRPDGSADPTAQLNIMNIRCAALVAGERDRIPLAGDQLYLDLDLSPANLPPGTRLALGSAIIEVTPTPHTGCAKFTQRFGLAQHRWINGSTGRAISLRGICAKVVQSGTVRRGDTVSKVS